MRAVVREGHDFIRASMRAVVREGHDFIRASMRAVVREGHGFIRASMRAVVQEGHDFIRASMEPLFGKGTTSVVPLRRESCLALQRLRSAFLRRAKPQENKLRLCFA